MELTPSQIIDALGGTTKVAKMCGIKPPSVTGWRTSGIPKPWMKFFQVKYASVIRKVKQAA